MTIVAPPNTGVGSGAGFRQMAEDQAGSVIYADITPDRAAGDPGHLDDAVILREGGIGKRADRRGDQAANTIREDPAFQA